MNTNTTKPLRIIFMGSPAFAVPALRALVETPQLAAVVTVISQPDKPSGRGLKLHACPVKTYAESCNLPTLTPTRIKTPEFANALAALQPDVIIVVAYGRILPEPILALPRLGCLNIHASLLPRHRGASPITHAILAGDTHAGVCIMQMDAGLDTGPVYAQESLPISPTDTTETLGQKLSECGANLLVQTLPKIAEHTIVPMSQNDTLATYAPLLQKSVGLIDFTRTAQEIDRHIRAYTPWPGAFTFYNNKRMGILAAAPCAYPPLQTTNPIPAAGTFLQDQPNTPFVVACGDNTAICIQTLKPESSSSMPAAHWMRGRRPEAPMFFSAHST